MKIACGLTRAVAPKEIPGRAHSNRFSLFETTRVNQTVNVIREKYMVSGIKNDTGIATGLSAVTDAANMDQRKVRKRLAIRKVNRTVPKKNSEFIDFVQV
jgi:hypothetical protein